MIAQNSQVKSYARLFVRSTLIALAIGIFLPALVFSLNCFLPSWWASLPYAWTHALSYVFLPGYIVWSVLLATKHGMPLAIFAGVAVNTLLYAVAFYLPVLAVEFTIYAKKDSKS
jgi:hypothetical protein